MQLPLVAVPAPPVVGARAGAKGQVLTVRRGPRVPGQVVLVGPVVVEFPVGARPAIPPVGQVAEVGPRAPGVGIGQEVGPVPVATAVAAPTDAAA